MMRSLVIVFFIITLFTLHGEAKKNEIKYPVVDIPAQLKANAKAVVRFEKREFELKSESKAVEHITVAITVLNENGLSLSNFQEFYNKFIHIGNISATVYSASGEKMHRIKNEDILDISATSSFSIYDDNRMKTFDPNTKEYPFTIEYTFEREFNGIFSFPTWHLFKDYNVSVEKAVYIIKSSNPEDIRVKQRNLNIEPVVTLEDGLHVKTWSFSDYSVRKKEPFSQNIVEYTPIIQLAPKYINISGEKGTLDSWTNYGRFIKQLNDGRDLLTEETKDVVVNLTKDAVTDFEKIKLIYEYMQNKTRYVSIQVGMGGWQPVEAEVVDRLGYGDCKALSNYMKAMLKEAGIKSIYTLVNAGSNVLKMDCDFPSNQFNHAILCVPLENDTVWLECTSQQIPCGFISTFTDDRDVLLIEEDGGKIAHTNTYTVDDNVQERLVIISLDSKGDAIAEVKTKYKGIQYDNVSAVLRMDNTDKEKFILRRISIPNFNLINHDYSVQKSRIPNIEEELKLGLRSYASTIGNRLVLPLNPMNKQTYIPSYLRNRESKVIVRRPFKDKDTAVFNIPEGYKIDKLPKEISINSPFGTYQANVKLEDNTIVYSREFVIEKGNYSKESYSELRDFFEKVSGADEMKCLLTVL